MVSLKILKYKLLLFINLILIIIIYRLIINIKSCSLSERLILADKIMQLYEKSVLLIDLFSRKLQNGAYKISHLRDKFVFVIHSFIYSKLNSRLHWIQFQIYVVNSCLIVVRIWI